MLERRDIWDLSKEDTWHPIILYYARAVGVLRSRDKNTLAEPSSWGYLAAIHGTKRRRNQWPTGATWNECQHGGWYFLPWHRIYLHYFENIIREAVNALRGGPPGWALPFWNYSDQEQRRALPPAFLATTLPDGAPNPLFVQERNDDIKRGEPLSVEAVNLEAMFREEQFVGPGGNLGGFGGSVSPKSHRGDGARGALENTPHGDVHGEVGGWMGAFETAGLDPIFWLHHANIDRLWEMWLRAGVPRTNPTDIRWMDTTFTIGHGPRQLRLSVREVIDTRKAPLNYFYTGIRDGIQGVPEAAGAGGPQRMTRRRLPEFIGGSKTGIPLRATPTHVDIEVSAPKGPAAAEGRAETASLPKTYLSLENVTGEELSTHAYSVYIGVPEGANPRDYPDRLAGRLALFGVREASLTDDQHSGSGVSVSFDITELTRRLQASDEWDPRRLRVTLAPAPPKTSLEARTEGDVQIGRISVYVG